MVVVDLRRKKALLRVNDRGGVWRMCILALCRACVLCVLYVRASSFIKLIMRAQWRRKAREKMVSVPWMDYN